jgi:hypothetical protein
MSESIESSSVFGAFFAPSFGPDLGIKISYLT